MPTFVLGWVKLVPAIVASLLGDLGQGRVGVRAPARPVFRLPLALWLAASALAVACLLVLPDSLHITVGPEPYYHSSDSLFLGRIDSAFQDPAVERDRVYSQFPRSLACGVALHRL